jgi:hypothetical protein
MEKARGHWWGAREGKDGSNCSLTGLIGCGIVELSFDSYGNCPLVEMSAPRFPGILYLMVCIYNVELAPLRCDVMPRCLLLSIS